MKGPGMEGHTGVKLSRSTSEITKREANKTDKERGEQGSL